MTESIKYSTEYGSIIVIDDLFSDFLINKVLKSILTMPLIKGTPESGGFDTISFDMGARVCGFNFNNVYNLIYERLKSYLLKEFGISVIFDGSKIGNPSIKIQNPGQYHVVHSDYAYSNSTANIASKILNINSISSIICLSSNYVGGRLIFPDENISVDMKAGSACVFTSTGHRHGVTEVLGGVRYSLLNFGEVI
jgi:hypothetical protein